MGERVSKEEKEEIKNLKEILDRALEDDDKYLKYAEILEKTKKLLENERR
jgi:hypothetical protein